MVKVVIINGSGGVGKDQFVTEMSKYCNVQNNSSVDKVKEAGKVLGWNGVSKSEKDRLFLSDLKLLSTAYCDHPFEYLKSVVKTFRMLHSDSKDLNIVVLHVRECDEIEKLKNYYDDNCVTVLIRNNRVKKITSNMADAGVEDYTYDCVVVNDGTIEELNESARVFVEAIECDIFCES